MEIKKRLSGKLFITILLGSFIIMLVNFYFLFPIGRKGYCDTLTSKVKFRAVIVNSTIVDTPRREEKKSGCLIKTLEAVQVWRSDKKRDKDSSIATVIVTITGEGLTSPIQVTLTKSDDGYWVGELPDVPAGVQLTFRAEARDANGNLLFEDSIGTILEANQDADISFHLAPPPRLVVPPPLSECLSNAPSFKVTPVQEVVDTKTDNQCGLSCTVTTVKLGKNFDETVLYSPGSNLIYPGAIVSALSITTGIPQPVILLPGYQRPLTVSVLGLSLVDNTRVVEDPYAGSVDSAISDILTSNLGTASTAANISVEVIEAHTREQAGIEGGLSAIFDPNNSISAGFNFENLNESRTVFIKVIQRYYTATVRLYPKGEYYFNNSVNYEDLCGQIEPGDVPVIISDVVYGRILIYEMSNQQEITKDKIEASFKAKVLGQGNLTDELERVFETSEKRVLVLGGDPEAAVKIINSEDAAEFFKVGLRWGANSPGVPLIYRLRYMSEGMPGFSYGKTTEFQIKDCRVVGGDNQYNIKWVGLDHGPENNYHLNRDGSPVCNNCWDHFQQLGDPLTINFPKDSNTYGDTFLFVEQDTNLRVGFDSDVGAVWLNDVEITASPLQMHLKKGWNHLEFTCYNQNNTARIAISSLADKVLIMDSKGCNP